VGMKTFIMKLGEYNEIFAEHSLSAAVGFQILFIGSCAPINKDNIIDAWLAGKYEGHEQGELLL